jgi:undecaprenyl pyrophosphate phosphatase UppP
MNHEKAVKLSVILPLIGLTLGWIFFITAIYSDLFYPYPQYDNNGRLLTEPQVQVSTYLFLSGIAIFSGFSLWGQKRALRLRNENDSALAKSSHRLNNLAVIVALVAGAVYAIGNFLGAFNNYDSRDVPALVRIFGVYVPIVLATIMVVTLILFAFVFRQDAPDLENTEKDEERARLQRYVGLAYASPIIGTAIAVILGLVVYDTTRTDLDVWIWVVIQAIIATSIILGTSFAAKVRLARPLEPKPKLRGIAAVNLNLVITIVFGVVVTIMSFAFGATAVDELREWPEYKPGMTEALMPTIKPAGLTWFISKMLPAITLLALAEFGIYRTLVVRNTKKDQIA